MVALVLVICRLVLVAFAVIHWAPSKKKALQDQDKNESEYILVLGVGYPPLGDLRFKGGEGWFGGLTERAAKEKRKLFFLFLFGKFLFSSFLPSFFIFYAPLPPPTSTFPLKHFFPSGTNKS